MAQSPPPDITPAPTPAPIRGDRATFSSRVDAFVTWLTSVVAMFNALALNVYNNAVDAYNNALIAFNSASTASAAASTAVNAPGSGATSTTSMTIGTGSRTFIIQTGKLFGVGQFVTMGNGANVMSGSVTAHNPATGSMTVDVTNIKGSGTFTSWTIGLAGAPGNPNWVPVIPPFAVTAVAALDFLTVFSSNTAFDEFIIIEEGINTASSNSALAIQFANAGTVDSGNNYYNTQGSSSTTFTKIAISTNFATTGTGGNGQHTVMNVNAVSSPKSIFGFTSSQQDASTYAGTNSINGVYKGGAISGFRLTWNDGSNFKAQGTIRIYGVNKV